MPIVPILPVKSTDLTEHGNYLAVFDDDNKRYLIKAGAVSAF